MAYKCFVDGMIIPTCVLDVHNPQDCNCAQDLVAENEFATKWDCGYWRQEVTGEVTKPRGGRGLDPKYDAEEHF